METSKHTVEFKPSGRGNARCEPDPNYPNGIAIDGAPNGEKYCFVELPYPAPECGLWMIHCRECKICVMVTAAGRSDDPISIRIPCKANA